MSPSAMKFLCSEAKRPHSDGQRRCPKTGRLLKPRRVPRCLAMGLSGIGLLSLLWFLARVIPKPSRASYPCQRVAFPVASGFVVSVLALMGSSYAWRKLRSRGTRFWKACLWGAAAAVCSFLVVANLPTPQVSAFPNPEHGPLGVAKGIFPGRVVWVHAPEATSWAGYSSPERWWQTNHTDLAVVEEMMSKAVRGIGGGNSDAAAWDAIFRNFNETHGRGQRGYQAGEKIAIKINLTTCNARSGTATVNINGDYEKKASIMNTIDNSPQMLLTLLRHLVYTAGVGQADISIGDPTGNFPKYLWDFLYTEFPNVVYFDNYGGAGRRRVELSKVPFNWSTPDATGTVQDFVPVPFAEADYFINFAVLKGHSAGVTVCGKNLYGALLRCPDGYFRDANGKNQGGNLDYLSMHASIPDPGAGGTPGMGHYRAIVDLAAHPALGGKTLLFLVDGLFGGYFWDSHPYKWTMPPFNGRWPSSLFASQDPVAIDSVCYDFLLNEWPNVVRNGRSSAGDALDGGAEDYLHEMAQAENPASGISYDPGKTGARLQSLGVHEHWNNAIDKKYSRNLGLQQGIELLALTASRPAPLLAIRKQNNQAVVSWQSSLSGFRLQSTTNLAGPALWNDVGGSPTLIEGRNVLTNWISSPQQFYRVVSP